MAAPNRLELLIILSLFLSLKYTTSGEYPGCDKGGRVKRGCDKRGLRQKEAAVKGVPRVQLRFQWAFSKQKACVRSLSPPCRTRAVPYIWVARGRLEMLATRALRVAE